MVIYGGDEVSALVASAGNTTLAAGYAGEDTPKSIVNTSYGQVNDKLYFGDEGPDVFRPNLEVHDIMSDRLVNDFDKFEKLLDYTFKNRLKVDTSDHPLLLTEPAWNSIKHRETLAEIAFEKFNVPGFYIANDSVLSAFAAGKSTALIIDIGDQVTSVTPIVDGFVLRKGVVRFQLGAQSISNAYLQSLEEGQRVNVMNNLIPHQLIESKTTVDLGNPPKFNLRNDKLNECTESWRNYANNKIIKDWRENTSAVNEFVEFDENILNQRPLKSFEFPNGYSDSYGLARFKANEILFQPHLFTNVPQNVPKYSIDNPSIPTVSNDQLKSLSDLIKESIQAAETDSRTALLSNVVVVGGVSITQGLNDRIQNEIYKVFPGARIKVHTSANAIERKYAAWLGGSMLGSLGTFHQLWISQEEWKDIGKPIVGMRCK